MRHENTVFVGKPEAKRPFGKLSCTWEDNIKMNLQKGRCENVDPIHLA
jgi:hypothetical protein